MNLPKHLFKPGTFKLRDESRNYLKGFFLEQELGKLRSDYGYTPPFDEPCPDPWWPWPINPIKRRDFLQGSLDRFYEQKWSSNISNSKTFFGSGKPAPDDDYPWPWPWGPWVRDFIGDRIFDTIRNSPLRKNTYNLIDVIKRENIATEALSELSENLSNFQKTLSIKLGDLK